MHHRIAWSTEPTRAAVSLSLVCSAPAVVSAIAFAGQHSQCRGLPVPAGPTSADMCPIAMFVAPEKSVVRPW